MALARETGWTPEFIVWELGLAERARYRHALLWLDGRRCRRRKAGGAESRRAEYDRRGKEALRKG